MFDISLLKNTVRKNHIAKKGQKGIWVSSFFHLFFILLYSIKAIHIILHTIYVSISHGKLKLTQSINPIIIAILKSPHHIHAHFDIIICKKKNIKIANTQTTQFSIAISDRSIQVWTLNKYSKKIDIDINIISTISCNSFSIITYNIDIIIKLINIAESHTEILSIHTGNIFINEKSLNSVWADKATNIIHIQVKRIHSCISRNNIS